MKLMPLLLALVLTTGCAGHIAIEVDTEPQGAMVFRQDNGDFLGNSPTGVVVLEASKKSVPITIRMMNYKPKTILVPSQVTYESPEEARQHVTSYRFVLTPRY